MSRTESGRTEVEDNRQKLLSVPEKCTMSEEKVLSDDRKKTPVRSQGRRGGERLMERPWLQLMCCAPVSGREVVAYFGVREVAKIEVLRTSEGVGVDKERLGPDDVNLQTEELHCNYSVLIVRAE